MTVVDLSPLQAVNIFGWLRPRRVLRWTDVVDSESITFSSLREVGLSNKQLFSLQPDVAEWVKHGGVVLQDAVVMKEWNVHPIRDMKADLGDLMALHWSAASLRSMNVSYSDLVSLGLGPDNMHMFGYTLLGWHSLGLTYQDVKKMTDAQIARVFCTTRQVTEKCFIGNE